MRQRATCKPTAIDLFSGCGGLTLGLRLAGFRVCAAVELDSKAQATYSANHPRVRLFRADIQSLTVADILQDVGLRAGELDLLAGCPPCQGFSRLRTRNRDQAVEDPRNDLLFEFLRFARQARPKTVMMENVPGLQHDVRFQRLCRALKGMGYMVRVEVLDAADFGVAQRRRRLILVASRVHVPSLAKVVKNRRTVRDVLGALEEPAHTVDLLHAVPERRSPAVMKLIRQIPLDGGSRSKLPDSEQLACHRRTKGFYDVYGRMAWDKVGPTITSGCINPSKGRFLHPEQHRTITLREAALLQGFPRAYRFDPNLGKEAIALMIGNALPPPFIRVHARALRAGLEGAYSNG